MGEAAKTAAKARAARAAYCTANASACAKVKDATATATATAWACLALGREWNEDANTTTNPPSLATHPHSTAESSFTAAGTATRGLLLVVCGCSLIFASFASFASFAPSHYISKMNLNLMHTYSCCIRADGDHAALHAPSPQPAPGSAISR